MKVVARFEVPYYQFLGETSAAIAKLPEFSQDRKYLLHLYRLMVLIRTFDSKAISLQRTGKLGTYPSTRGQEAVFVGIGAALASDDIFVPYYRDVGTLIQRGVSLTDILMYWGGDERGNCFSQNTTDMPFSVPVGSQPLHAAGIATALKIRGEKRAVLTTCGDGATSQGDFYEAMNLAGVWRLPLVFVVSNNQWAISVSRDQQTAAETLAQKAIAAGFNGEQVDGNDVIAVRERVHVALEAARNEHKPTLLEIISYRQSDHTTADDASRYEAKGARDAAWVHEPIARLRVYLENQGWWSAAEEEAYLNECQAEVEKSVNAYLAMPPQDPASIFDYLYQTLPSIYQTQRDDLLQKGNLEHE